MKNTFKYITMLGLIMSAANVMAECGSCTKPKQSDQEIIAEVPSTELPVQE